MSEHYTLATYRVIPGREDDFIKTWNDLAVTFTGLEHPPHWGALIRSTRDPTLFHSFGPWENTKHIEAMRKSPEAKAAFKALQVLCLAALSSSGTRMRNFSSVLMVSFLNPISG